ncbi:hypothetical protein CI105_04025 [Candidatus Izimaplasma bacterium ZiA1]|uniref:peptidylprolyl isomerase n=1 Tax=Candidatus Izimoplasma sp. ZiA1 TaxID=2024899 RepID=UPI000BAA72FB|nr:hypothetical protein CI105_04025 [Candidatus Izimaplasma bacterium ZiA1]
MKKIFIVITSLIVLIAISGPVYGFIKNALPEKVYKKPVVTIVVEDYGTITVELDPNIAKNTVDNFLMYVQDNAYTGTTFHRVIEDFMIQGGMVDVSKCPIKGEFSANGVENNLSHEAGVISTARTNDPNSATSQFFIMHKTNTGLDGNYAAFGKVVTGLDIVDQIAVVNTTTSDTPVEDVVISSITVDLNGYKPGTPKCAN